MKRLILTLAAALTLGGAFAASAGAQPPGDRDGTVVRTTRTVVMHRHQDWRRDGDRGDRGWHRGWNRGRHMGWRNHHRVCRTMWRHGNRITNCRSW